MWYLQTMENYWALKKEILPLATAWMNLEDIMLREISQIKGKIVHGSTYMRILKQSNSLKESRMVIAKGWGQGEMGSCLPFSGNKVPVTQDE